MKTLNCGYSLDHIYKVVLKIFNYQSFIINVLRVNMGRITNVICTLFSQFILFAVSFDHIFFQLALPIEFPSPKLLYDYVTIKLFPQKQKNGSTRYLAAAIFSIICYYQTSCSSKFLDILLLPDVLQQ